MQREFSVQAEGKGLRKDSPSHVLIFENKTEGHHLHWLRYIAEDFASTGKQLTLAIDMRPESEARVGIHLAGLMDRISILPAYGSPDSEQRASTVGDIADCLARSGAEEVFINNFDEIASWCLRRAAFGIYPPPALKGKISGVYFRPRFLSRSLWTPGIMIKAAGYYRLSRGGWFNKIFLLDEYLLERARGKYAHQQYFLPDPWDADFPFEKREARKKLGIEADRFVFLCFGVGDRRKGLHLAIRAVKEMSGEFGVCLLCAGRISPDRKTAGELKELQRQGRAHVIDHYVSDVEQSLCFCASDAVLLPYIRHFGSSGVLSLAAAARKPVVASDEDLLGRRIRQHDLGLLFRSGDVKDLREKMIEAISISENRREQFIRSASRYAALCSRQAFRKALLSPYEV